MSKWVLASCDRDEMNLVMETFETKKEAHDEMLKEILNERCYENEEEVVEASNQGEAYYGDDEAWIQSSICGTVVWSIKEVK